MSVVYKTVVGAHYNHFGKVIQMNTHNIRFHGGKSIPGL